MIVPTALHARGDPARDAISPYVETRPDGIRRTADRTRCLNEVLPIHAPQGGSFSSRPPAIAGSEIHDPAYGNYADDDR